MHLDSVNRNGYNGFPDYIIINNDKILELTKRDKKNPE